MKIDTQGNLSQQKNNGTEEYDKLNKDRKTVLDFHEGLSELSLKILEKNVEWSSAIEERALSFSQFLFSFLFSIGAAVITLFYSVNSLNSLIINHNIFSLACWIYFISLILFIFYFKERIDNDSSRLIESSQQSDVDYNNSYSVIERQLKNGINLDTFYEEIRKLKKEHDVREKNEKVSGKNYPDYYLELFISLLMISFWILLFSTQSWCFWYLYLGIFTIIILVNNQNRYFYKFVNYYSRIMGRIFPTKY